MLEDIKLSSFLLYNIISEVVYIMDRAIKTNQIFTDMLKCDPKLLEEIKLKQKISLFENLSIEDNQPVVLTFNTSVGASVDPLITTISTQIQVDYPATNQVLILKEAIKKAFFILLYCILY